MSANDQADMCGDNHFFGAGHDNPCACGKFSSFSAGAVLFSEADMAARPVTFEGLVGRTGRSEPLSDFSLRQSEIEALLKLRAEYSKTVRECNRVGALASVVLNTIYLERLQLYNAQPDAWKHSRAGARVCDWIAQLRDDATELQNPPTPRFYRHDLEIGPRGNDETMPAGDLQPGDSFNFDDPAEEHEVYIRTAEPFDSQRAMMKVRDGTLWAFQCDGPVLLLERA